MSLLLNKKGNNKNEIIVEKITNGRENSIALIKLETEKEAVAVNSNIKNRIMNLPINK